MGWTLAILALVGAGAAALLVGGWIGRESEREEVGENGRDRRKEEEGEV